MSDSEPIPSGTIDRAAEIKRYRVTTPTHRTMQGTESPSTPEPPPGVPIRAHIAT